MGAKGGDAFETTRAIFNRGLKSGNDPFFWTETAPQVSQEQLSLWVLARTFCPTTTTSVNVL